MNDKRMGVFRGRARRKYSEWQAKKNAADKAEAELLVLEADMRLRGVWWAR